MFVLCPHKIMGHPDMSPPLAPAQDEVTTTRAIFEGDLMRRGHYVLLTCACGRDSTTMMADLPRSDRDATGWVMTDAALARLRCSRCGWVGRPAEIRFGWSAGLPSQSDRNKE